MVLSYCQVLSRANNDGDYTKETLDEFRVPAHLNYAACCLKLNEYQECVNQCNEALERQPNNMKGLFRRGVALARRGLDLDGAQNDLERVMELDPENTDAVKEMKLLAKKLR